MDFRLKTFKKVAEKLSFTQAAKELFITQPAVTKHINKLEEEFGVKLFHRKGNRIALTEAGRTMLKYVREIEDAYNRMDFALSALRHQRKGKLKIGASTTMTHYVLPRLMGGFKSRFPDLAVSVINGNTQQIERALDNAEIDLGIIEGQSKRSGVHYVKFLEDRIVLVANSRNRRVEGDEISITDLPGLPLILREAGSGTLEVVAHYLKQKNLRPGDLKVEMRFGSTEGIKNYILHTGCFAFLSVQSIQKELVRNELKIIRIRDLDIKRNFYFIYPEGQQNPLTELFIRFALHYNF